MDNINKKYKFYGVYMARLNIKSIVSRYTKKAAVCENCGRNISIPVHGKHVCPYCGSHKIKPKKRPY
jgi:rRNA maturation endonuclease Nob1